MSEWGTGRARACTPGLLPASPGPSWRPMLPVQFSLSHVVVMSRRATHHSTIPPRELQVPPAAGPGPLLDWHPRRGPAGGDASCHRAHHHATGVWGRTPSACAILPSAVVGKRKAKAKGGRFVCLLCCGLHHPPQGGSSSSSSGRSPSPAPGRPGRCCCSSRRRRIGRGAAGEAGPWTPAPDPAAARGSTTTTASPRAGRSPPRSKVLPQSR